MDYKSVLKKYGLTNIDEYSFFEREELQNVHLLALGGSKAYGTNIPTSDTDLRGFATNSLDNILLGKNFDKVENQRTDTVIYSLETFIDYLTKCNPNCIEIISGRDKDVLYQDEIGKILRDNRHLFYTNKCIFTFSGYANEQLRRLQQTTKNGLSEQEYNDYLAKTLNHMRTHLRECYGDIVDKIDIYNTPEGLMIHIPEMTIKGEDLSKVLGEINNVISVYNKNSKRNNHAIIHDKIEKHAMHLVRLYLQGTELITTGTFCTYREKDHDLLMSIRNGKYTDENNMMTKEFFELVDDIEKKFHEAETHSVLPKNPDMDKINRLHRDINDIMLSEYYSKDRDELGLAYPEIERY